MLDATGWQREMGSEMREARTLGKHFFLHKKVEFVFPGDTCGTLPPLMPICRANWIRRRFVSASLVFCEETERALGELLQIIAGEFEHIYFSGVT